jgi:hypothetical protein
VLTLGPGHVLAMRSLPERKQVLLVTSTEAGSFPSLPQTTSSASYELSLHNM